MIVWPSTVPLPIKYGAESEFGKGSKISTDMDYGNKTRRRRFTNVPTYQTIQVSFTDNQYNDFINFYQSVLLDGVVSFYANVIVGADIAVARCTIDDDSLKVLHETYNRHTIEMTLELYNAVGVDGGTSWLIGFYGEEFVINTLCDPLEYIVNEQYPEIMEVY
jgi:hypothetical protein